MSECREEIHEEYGEFFDLRFFFLLTQGSYLSCRDKAADSWSSQNKIEKFRESRANLPESIETWLHRLVFPCWQFLCHRAVNVTPKQGTKGRQWTMGHQLSWLGHSWWHVAIVHFFERHNIFMTSYKTNTDMADELWYLWKEAGG